MELGGWQLAWSEISGFERVRRRAHGQAWSPGSARATRRIRVHYDACMRFVTVDVHAPLAELFAAVDAAAAAPRAA